MQFFQRNHLGPWPLLAASLLLATACGSSQAPKEGTAGHLDDPQWTAESKGEESKPAPPQEPARDPACSGADLDASRLGRMGVCNIDGTAQDLPKTIVASLASSKAEAISGQEVEVKILLRNSGSAAEDVFLDHSCGFENLTTNKVLRDEHEQRLDRVGRADCALDAACVGQVAHFTLAPKGTVTITLPLKAAVSVIGDGCEEMPGRALSPGNYSVTWQTPYTQDALVTKLKVNKLERIAKSECKSYARNVSKKAEPDAALREGVRKSLLTKCQKEQPSKAYAQCMMKAETEEALKACR